MCVCVREGGGGAINVKATILSVCSLLLTFRIVVIVEVFNTLTLLSP